MFYSLRQIAPESKFSHLLYLDVFEQIIPLALICEVLSQTQRWEKRERALNMVTVIVVIIAMGLLPYLSIAHVLQKITSGLRYVWPDPCMKLPGASAALANDESLWACCPCAACSSGSAAHVPAPRRRAPFSSACG
jgi:hypothetical protein